MDPDEFEAQDDVEESDEFWRWMGGESPEPEEDPGKYDGWDWDELEAPC